MATVVGEYSNDQLLLDPVTGQYAIGDLAGALNSGRVVVDDIAQRTSISQNTIVTLLLDFQNNLYRFGAVGGANDTIFTLDDQNRTAVIQGAGDNFLSIDMVTNLYEFGDISTSSNGTKLSINDVARLVEIRTTLGAALSLDQATGAYFIGDINGVGNGTTLTVLDVANVFSFNNTANTAGILINGVPGFTGTVTPVVSITVNNGIVTNVI